MADYPSELTLREALATYFRSNGVPPGGGYDDKWVVIRARSIPIAAFPNTAERVRALRLHDLHHVLTGYDTDLAGEAEIGAWEIASGCRDFWAAWVLNGLAALAGLFDATEWRYLGRDYAGVDANDPVFQFLGHAPDTGKVVGIEIGGETKDCVVGLLDHVFFVFEREQRCDRAEGFIVGDLHIAGNACKDGGFKERTT